MIKKSKREAIKSWADIATVISSIAVVVGLYCTVEALQGTRQLESAKLILEINRDLRSEQFKKISHAIEGGFDNQKHNSDTKILIASGGAFSEGELEDYLDVYNDIGVLYQMAYSIIWRKMSSFIA